MNSDSLFYTNSYSYSYKVVGSHHSQNKCADNQIIPNRASPICKADMLL